MPDEPKGPEEGGQSSFGVFNPDGREVRGRQTARPVPDDLYDTVMEAAFGFDPLAGPIMRSPPRSEVVRLRTMFRVQGEELREVMEDLRIKLQGILDAQESDRNDQSVALVRSVLRFASMYCAHNEPPDTAPPRLPDDET